MTSFRKEVFATFPSMPGTSLSIGLTRAFAAASHGPTSCGSSSSSSSCTSASGSVSPSSAARPCTVAGGAAAAAGAAAAGAVAALSCLSSLGSMSGLEAKHESPSRGRRNDPISHGET
eukprot:7386224-Prymnesium_polylepis.2